MLGLHHRRGPPPPFQASTRPAIPQARKSSQVTTSIMPGIRRSSLTGAGQRVSAKKSASQTLRTRQVRHTPRPPTRPASQNRRARQVLTFSGRTRPACRACRPTGTASPSRAMALQADVEQNPIECNQWCHLPSHTYNPEPWATERMSTQDGPVRGPHCPGYATRTRALGDHMLGSCRSLPRPQRQEGRRVALGRPLVPHHDPSASLVRSLAPKLPVRPTLVRRRRLPPWRRARSSGGAARPGVPARRPV
jgi:hypothetical protein